MDTTLTTTITSLTNSLDMTQFAQIQSLPERSLWVDPSYAGTGLTLIDIPSKTITLECLSHPGNVGKTIPQFALAADLLFHSFQSFLPKESLPLTVFIELPFLFGQSSAALCMLFSLYLHLFKSTPYISHVYGIQPSFISRAVKSISNDDSDKIRHNLALQWLSNKKKLGYSLVNFERFHKMNGVDTQTAILFSHFYEIGKLEHSALTPILPTP